MRNPLTWLFRGILLLVFLAIFARLFELQVIKGNYFRTLAEENRIKRIPIMATRGIITARGGESLATNEPLKLDNSELFGNKIIIENKREYPMGSAAAHISGYLGEVSPEEIGKIDPACPEKGAKLLGSMVGRSGLEEEYDCKLRGVDGEELLEVDTMGKIVRVLGRKDPISGENIKTTIDINLQKNVAEVMDLFRQKGGKHGAVVISDGQGQILSLYSSPSYDPNLFIEGDAKKVANILGDSNIPLFNRAIGGVYHPGSVFKIITATAALEEGKIDKNFLYQDPGIITVNGFSYSNWFYSQYGSREGEIGLVKAIARSTDTFFYKVGEMVGPQAIADWAKIYGLTKPTNIDLPGEIGSFIPTPQWKENFLGERWFLGNTYHLAIGQGDVVLTPLAVNMETSLIASDGYLCQPGIVKDSKCIKIQIKQENIDLIKEGMVDVCKTGGTAFPFFDFKISGSEATFDVACKTGTAETNKKNISHAWFTAFAPVTNPQIVATLLVEEGGEGSSVAAPLVRKIMDDYFKK